MTDVIDRLAGIEPGSSLDELRGHRPEARRNAQLAYEALFAPRDPADLPVPDFYTTGDGLPQAERELAATAASRLNGCVFCASVHSRFAGHFSGRADEVQKLLDEGTGTDLGERWTAVVTAAAALTTTPADFGQVEIAALRSAGLDDLEILDVINSAAFFNWANRLMLSMGEPTTGRE